MRNLGLVVFSNYSGLGNQSRRLAQFMKPERILLIDNSPFSRNTDQHPEWYQGFTGFTMKGFPTRAACIRFIQGLTHLYIIENPLNWDLLEIAKGQNVKVYIASNYEFCDNLVQPHLPTPDKFLMPSYWKVGDMEMRFGQQHVEYLPPPIFPEEFAEVRDENFKRTGKRRFLHIVGTLAAADRNGTLALLQALKYSKGDYDLVIKSQHDLPANYVVEDRRVKYQYGSSPEVSSMYRDYDALIMPRRFGGLCLPVQEALISGMPVIMPNISPNSELLPEDWLVKATLKGTITTRTEIDLYEADPYLLGQKIDDFAKRDLEKDKIDAFEIAYKEFAPASLERRYEQLWQS